MLLQARINTPDRVNSKSFMSKFFASDSQELLKSVNFELDEGLTALEKMFYIENKEHEVPVAFVTNALYVMAKNQSANPAVINNHLLPILKAKA